MNRIFPLLTLALLAALPLAGCQRSEPAQAPVAAGDHAATNPVSPPPVQPTPPDPAAEAEPYSGSYADGLAVDPTELQLAAAAAKAPAYTGSSDVAAAQARVDASMQRVRESFERVRQANERLRQGQASNPPPAGNAVPPASTGSDFRMTGNSSVPKSPALANDVIRTIQLAFEVSTSCKTISGIDANVTAADGPFNTNAQGRLVSGTILETWNVSGCGKTQAFLLGLKPRPDATVDFVVKQI